jgi:hypothetical protein
MTRRLYQLSQYIEPLRWSWVPLWHHAELEELFLEGMIAIVLTAFLAALFAAVRYWGSFRQHWRVHYERGKSGLRVTRSGRMLLSFPSGRIIAAQNSCGAVTL